MRDTIKPIPMPKACLKCGMDNIEIVEVDSYSQYWEVVCIYCGLKGVARPTIRRAVDFWNNDQTKEES
jgi:transcription elongation factor Elf1